MLIVAREYVERGLSPIPIRTDGSKRPVYDGWNTYGKRCATEEELAGWFGNGKIVGVGIACGPASGNLIVLDIESTPAWEAWRACLDASTTDFLDLCPIVITPRGGRHVWCRVPEPIHGTKLAQHADKSVKIETRGCGHQVLAPGCPANCHPSGKIYIFEQRGWLDGNDRPILPMSVFESWCESARSLNEYKSSTTPPRERRPAPDEDPDSVFARFNRAQTLDSISTLLVQHGWKYAGERAGRRDFTRPGKDDGTSGNATMVDGVPIFYAFTNSTDLPADKGLNPTQLRAHLEHRGDFAALAKKLKAEGFDPPVNNPPRKPAQPPPGGTTQPPAEDPGTPLTGAETILKYFRNHYQPDFRRGSSIHTQTGEMVHQLVACGAANFNLINLLSVAVDAPRYPDANPKRDQLPGFFKKWASVAWGQLLTELPDEDEAKLGIDSTAGDEFRRMVRDAMLSEITLNDIIERVGVTQVERRSLIDWCVKFAKPGPWRTIRSKKCWCKVEKKGTAEIILRVAIRVELFAQIRADKLLCSMNQNTFARRAARYGVGSSSRVDRPQGRSAVVLEEEFLASLTEGLDEPAPSPEPAESERKLFSPKHERGLPD